MDKIIGIISILILIGLIYGFIQFETKKFSYKFLLIIISIWSCFVFFVLFFTDELSIFQGPVSETFTVINIILPIIMFLKPKLIFDTESTKTSFSLIIIWALTIFSGLLLLSTYGGIFLLVTQPLTYILCVYKMQKNDNRILIPIYFNLFMTLIIVFFSVSWIFKH